MNLQDIINHFKSHKIELVKVISDRRAIFSDGYLYFTVLKTPDQDHTRSRAILSDGYLYFSVFKNPNQDHTRWFCAVSYIDKLLLNFQCTLKSSVKIKA